MSELNNFCNDDVLPLLIGIAIGLGISICIIALLMMVNK
jgi:hypothetical protein